MNIKFDEEFPRHVHQSRHLINDADSGPGLVCRVIYIHTMHPPNSLICCLTDDRRSCGSFDPAARIT